MARVVMRPAAVRTILALLSLVITEFVLIWVFPSGWLGVALAWCLTIGYALRLRRPRIPKIRHRDRVGPPLEWID